MRNGRRVFVYRNLRRGGWSIRAMDGAERGKVIAHATHVLLHSAYGKVGEGGRQRVLRTRQKNVHAGIVGIWDPDRPYTPSAGTVRRVQYNPYTHATFTYNNGDPWTTAEDLVYLSLSGVYILAAKEQSCAAY